MNFFSVAKVHIISISIYTSNSEYITTIAFFSYFAYPTKRYLS